MSTYWKVNFIKFSIEKYFGICSIIYIGENPRRRGSNNTMRTCGGDEDDDSEEELGKRFR
jgi:hypothetical protein